MRKTVLVIMAMALVPFYAFAVDGVVLINQSTVNATGGFPYIISVSGSYKLSGNLVVPVGLKGIDITASSVTLDLNGFNITGNAFGTPGGALVVATGNLKGVTIRNGTISVNGGGAMDTQNTSGTVIEDLRLDGGGVALFGKSVIIRRVSYPGAQIGVTCPALVVDTLAAFFTRNQASSTAYTFGFVTGPVF